MKHKIASSRETVRGHYLRVVLTCTCGKRVHSQRGWDGAYQAFRKHQRRAEAKAKEEAQQ